jgi:hypothetical protein
MNELFIEKKLQEFFFQKRIFSLKKKGEPCEVLQDWKDR